MTVDEQCKMYVTGDTHGEEGRFLYEGAVYNQHLLEGDFLFICGDFGFVANDGYQERRFLRYLAEEKPYTILFVDGNHENFDLLDAMTVEIWNGGKVHVVARNQAGVPKVIHLMRGQVYEIKGKRIFTFGGGFSIDKKYRTPGVNWFEQEMPTDEQLKEAVANLEKVDNCVDFILTHTAPERTMQIVAPERAVSEMPLNNFLEFICENVSYKHWYFGHHHREEDYWKNQTCLWFSVRNMQTGCVVEE